MSRTDERLRLSLTDAGKIILRGTGYVALAALIIPAFGVLSVLVSVVLMALLVGFILRPKIRMTGNLPDRIIVDQTVRLRYVLKNVARLPAYNLCVRFSALPEAIEQAEGGSVVTRLGPGETAEVTVAIRPKRRGHYRIKQPICQSCFPFNLFSFGTSGDDEQSLIVLPTFSQLHIPLRRLSRYVQASGARLAGRTGVFLEYAGNRPFIPGDSPRRIDARAWARLSVPAIKEYHDDFDYCTALVLDTSVPDVHLRSRSNEIKELEAAVSLCASVAFTINNDCLIDLLLAGPDLHRFTAWPRVVRLDKIHEILAGIEPSKGYSLEQIAPILAERFYGISEVMFILLSWNKMYRQLLELAEQAGCYSTVILIDSSGRMHVDQDDADFPGNVQLLLPDEILTGQIKHL
jgi:uncharacterized protein (DUF58 family)